MRFTFDTVETNGQKLNVAFRGPENGPVMLMLHGFPEYWAAWADVAEHLSHRYRCIMPDQRGFNRSTKPDGVENYDAKHLVADMIGLLDTLGIDQPVILCGHDWGASVAYAMAMRHADRFSHLIIANGVHPICFQKALLGDPAQRAASQYITLLRQDEAAGHMAENGFARTFSMFRKFSAAPWLTDEKQAAFADAWGHDGALKTMLHWYSSSPMKVPPDKAPLETLDITDAMRAKYAVPLPHLLLWGLEDTALLPSVYEDLGEFTANLTIEEIDKASHWILHEHPKEVAGRITAFLAS